MIKKLARLSKLSKLLIVIQQIGGSDNRPMASVFRNKDNKFQKVGEISMVAIGDAIEKQLSENRKDRH